MSTNETPVLYAFPIRFLYWKTSLPFYYVIDADELLRLTTHLRLLFYYALVIHVKGSPTLYDFPIIYNAILSLKVKSSV